MVKTRFSSWRHRQIILTALLINKSQRERKRHRSLHMRQMFKNRTTQGEFQLMQDLNFDPEYHKKYFRMDKKQFEEILELIKPDISHKLSHSHPISARMRLAITLSYLAGGTSQVRLAMSYRVSPSSVGKIIRETMAAIIKHLKPLYLPPPKPNTWIESENIFRKRWNFPFCVGAIDGKHVRIKCPPKSGSNNFNYKGYFSVIVLAIVSGDYRFIFTDIGAPGGESDAAIFSKISLPRLVEEKKLYLPNNGKLGAKQAEVPYLFVGDEAFPLKAWLMRPFPGGNLNLMKRIYNYRLARARRIVENAFGIWAARWRILFTPIDGDEDLVRLIIETTLVLHNFLRVKLDREIYEDEVDEFGNILEDGNWRNNLNDCTGLSDIPRIGSNNYGRDAFSVREIFCDYFSSEEGRLPGQEAYVMRT